MCSRWWGSVSDDRRPMADGASNTSSPSRGTSVFTVAVEVFLLFVLTTMLLMMYAVRIQHDDYIRETIERARADALDQVRRERLRELQKTIFVGLKRPPDHTYNMFVSWDYIYDSIIYYVYLYVGSHGYTFVRTSVFTLSYTTSHIYLVQKKNTFF